MIIVSGGDSFVYGSELTDNMVSDLKPASQYTFSSLLSKNHTYRCIAWPGYGNDSIARTVIASCEKLDKSNIFVIVSWTFPGRYEFNFSYDTKQKKSPWYTITPWTNENFDNIKNEFVTTESGVEEQHLLTLLRAKETGIADFAESFYRNVGSTEYWEIYSTLKEIVYLQNYLKVNNIPYMFTCADNSILYNCTIKSTDENIQSLYQQIITDQDRWFWFPAGTNPQDTCNPRGFYQWAIENKYPMGTTHPLEEAHQDAAHLMKEKFNELVNKSI